MADLFELARTAAKDAVAIVREQAATAAASPAKRRRAVREVARRLDELLTWEWAGIAGPVLEALDRPVLRFLASLLVEAAYAGLRGNLDPEPPGLGLEST